MTRIAGANQYVTCIRWTQIYGVSNFHSLKQFLMGGKKKRKEKKNTKGSITIAKRKEDNGQPCLAPLCHFKKGEFKLLVCTDLVRILHNSFNPIFMKVFLKWRVWGFGGFVVVVGVQGFFSSLFRCCCFLLVLFGLMFCFVFCFVGVVLRAVNKYFHFTESEEFPSQLNGQACVIKLSWWINANLWIILSEARQKECRLIYVETICDELKCLSKPLLPLKASLKTY